jgi:pimeloyl-ACP methyl ester carboxylesterase
MNMSSIWREARVALEGVELYRSGRGLDTDLAGGDGSPVLLVPGYLAGDRALAPLANWLRHAGYAPQEAAISANVNCGTRTVDRLVERVNAIADAHGERVVIVGHSLGGVLGRVVAMRRPDLVRGVICLGSPLVDLQAVHPLVWAPMRLMGALSLLGVPGLLSRECVTGACCAESRRLSVAPFPDEVALVSVFSRRDGIVDWRACLDPWAEQVEVDSSHIGMVVNLAVYQVLAERLAAFGDVPLSQDEGTRAAA